MPPKAISTKPYADIGRAGKPVAQRKAILNLFDSHPPMNRRQIAEATRLPINGVCWRVKGMIDSGLLKIVGELEDPVTGQDAEMLFPTMEKVRQMEFRL